jgi:hypothetical protein
MASALIVLPNGISKKLPLIRVQKIVVSHAGIYALARVFRSRKSDLHGNVGHSDPDCRRRGLRTIHIGSWRGIEMNYDWVNKGFIVGTIVTIVASMARSKSAPVASTGGL